MDKYVKLICQEDRNIFIPVEVANLSNFLKNEIAEMKSKGLLEDKKIIEFSFEDISGDIMEIVMNYLNHKYYYETLKDINEVIGEDYKIPPEKALDVLKATIRLQC